MEWIVQEEVSNLYCKKCGYSFVIKPDMIYWDEKGYGYSTKLCRCPECNTSIIIEYYEDHGLDINKDTRWYI